MTEPICIEDGCNRPVRCKARCSTHYRLALKAERGQCQVGGCEKIQAATGLCTMHQYRMRRYGCLDLPTQADIFWSYVREDGDCWVWTGATNGAGYGNVNAATYGTPMAHRFAYLSMVGEIPDELELDHLCANRACVNPSHLEPVTPAENKRRTGERRTSCPHGHEYTPENIRLNTANGSRQCRACARSKRFNQTR